MGNCCNSRESVDPNSTPRNQNENKIVFSLDENTISTIRKSISSKNNCDVYKTKIDLTPPPSRKGEKIGNDLELEMTKSKAANISDKKRNDLDGNIQNTKLSTTISFVGGKEDFNIEEKGKIELKEVEDKLKEVQDKQESEKIKNEKLLIQPIDSNSDDAITNISEKKEAQTIPEHPKEINLIASKTMSEDYIKELEKKKEKIYNRFKEQEKEGNKNTDIDDQIDNYRLKHRLTAAKKRAGELNHRKSIKILHLAKQLEDHLHKSNEDREIKQEIKEIDEYTKLLLAKPLNSKKSRKFTRFNFVLQDDN